MRDMSKVCVVVVLKQTDSCIVLKVGTIENNLSIVHTNLSHLL